MLPGMLSVRFQPDPDEYLTFVDLKAASQVLSSLLLARYSFKCLILRLYVYCNWSKLVQICRQNVAVFSRAHLLETIGLVVPVPTVHARHAVGPLAASAWCFVLCPSLQQTLLQSAQGQAQIRGCFFDTGTGLGTFACAPLSSGQATGEQVEAGVRYSSRQLSAGFISRPLAERLTHLWMVGKHVLETLARATWPLSSCCFTFSHGFGDAFILSRTWECHHCARCGQLTRQLTCMQR